MKFINLALIALSSISLVLSKPTYDIEKCKDKLCYLLSGNKGGTAYVNSFNYHYQSSTVASIPSSVTFDGYTYRIVGIEGNMFKGLKLLEEVDIASGINDLTLTKDAFANCPSLKKVVLSNKYVTVSDDTSFTSPNKEVTFIGAGVKDYTDTQVKYLFKGLGLTKKTYKDEYDYDRKIDLFNLAKKLSNYARISDNADGDNAITVIKTKFGSSAGRARLYRLLAIEMGIKPKDILVAYDGVKNYWNYVKVDGFWYNADVNYPFRLVSEYYTAEWKRPFFNGNNDYKGNVSGTPSSWRVMFTNYGYKDEFRGQPTNDIFDIYLRQNNLGSRKN